MALLATVLLAVGLAEYLRHGGSPRRQLAEIAVMVLLVGIATWALGFPVATAALPVIAGLWWATIRTVRSWEVPGMVAVAVAALVSLAISSSVDRSVPPLADWYDGLDIPGLDGVGLDTCALALAAAFFLTGPANAVVRVALDRVGGGLLAQERQLKGGRVLGPIERIFVFAMAVGGAWPGVAAVVAAKSILRYPEISGDDPQGSRAEYVLVGSFVSWALALALVPLF